LTNDPLPVRYDGDGPVLRVEPVRIASIGSLAGLLSHAMVSRTSVGNVYYYINDHLGTPQRVMDEDGRVVWSADYPPGSTSIMRQAFIIITTVTMIPERGGISGRIRVIWYDQEE